MDRPIAGGGFALMAWELAKRRVGERIAKPSYNAGGAPPMPRASLLKATLPPPFFPASTEYYRIIDSATASWPAFAAERSLGICPKVRL